jgi:hypothetical protein
VRSLRVVEAGRPGDDADAGRGSGRRVLECRGWTGEVDEDVDRLRVE